ncbi:MAG TPA: glycosyltransferase family 2 protein [Acidiferrobacteraceae bacterium]|nr:glycosyltransferase family 2 protein [Acidiferrobacteraceae bacterium]
MTSERSSTHIVLIPSYNTGARVYTTVAEARAQWAPVWVVVDGSTDGTPEGLRDRARTDPDLHVIVLQKNQGKGAAVLAGLQAASQAGYTHALVMDADGQHPASQIREFMATSTQAPDAMILGVPIFGPEAPRLRVQGRRISNAWVRLETLSAIGDSLYGFRVYPIAPLIRVMGRRRYMRRFDFDPESVVRLSWSGRRAINLPAQVRYFAPEEGGVSHFRYLRDNALLTFMHLRLFAGFVLRLPALVRRRWIRPRPEPVRR